MASTWKTTVVRVECPPVVSLAEFLATMRTWLDHHCIVLVDDLKRVIGRDGAFDAEFDNPRDARLFGRRFADRPTPLARRRTVPKPSRWRKSPARKGAHPVGVWAAAETPSK
ncbi:MAG TPA: hypothetical protein VGR70_10105 [Stellaceae bacterium]|nr:hypothetical protein [Stellaceae bacterium]